MSTKDEGQSVSPNDAKPRVSSSTVSCPNFPYFGASYPDAGCIDGQLWDLDKCDDNGLYSSGDNPPCPFCNTEAFIDYHTEIDDKELQDMNNDESLSAEDRSEILKSNMTKEDATKLVEALKLKYG
jgi:hypothetical protein